MVARCLRCFYIDFDEVIRATLCGRPLFTLFFILILMRLFGRPHRVAPTVYNDNTDDRYRVIENQRPDVCRLLSEICYLYCHSERSEESLIPHFICPKL